MKNTFLASMLLCSLAGIAQPPAGTPVSNEFIVEKGTPYEVVDARNKYYFNSGNEVLTVKEDKEKVILQKLNTISLQFIKKTEFTDFPEHFELEHVAEFAGKYYLFYSHWEKPFEQLFCREIDFAKGEFTGQPRLLIRTDHKISFGDEAVRVFFAPVQTDKFDFYNSFDQKKLMIQYRLKPEKKSDNISQDIIGMNVFDKDMNKVWSREVEMPYTEKKMNNLDYSVDGQGNAYILTSVYDDNTTKIERGGKINYHIELLHISAESASIKTTPVLLENKHINRIRIYENSGNQMLCAGFYSKSRDRNDADGIYMFKMDREGKVFDVITHEIPLSIFNSYENARTQRKNIRNEKEDKADFDELRLRDLIIQKDGSLILIGEQYFKTVHTVTTSTPNGGTSSRTTTTHFYNDILISKLDATGNLVWMQKLPKNQIRSDGGHTRDDLKGGLSYKYMAQNGSHYLLFLDNIKNLTLPLDKVPARHVDGLGGFLTAYKINDADGTAAKLSVFDMRDIQGTHVYQFFTDRIVSLSDNSFVVELYKKKKEDILIKVSIGKGK